jgi:hypothetical protein
VSAAALPVERIISEAVVQALSDKEFLRRLEGADEDDAERVHKDEIKELTASIEKLSRDYYAEKMITEREFKAARKVLKPRLDAATAALASVTRRRPEKLLSGLDDLRAKWNGLGLDRQRALIELCIESVAIAPALGRPPVDSFDPARIVDVVWRA